MRMPNSRRSERGRRTRSGACDLRRTVAAGVCMALVLLVATDTPAQSKRAPRRYEATWESLRGHEVPQWYRDAKFGIFIHWGLYSVPAFANEWYPRSMYQSGTREFEHHVKTYGSQGTFGYKDFIPKFTAERFDPDAWAALFEDAGARFVVPVAEHHDGFAMYDSKFTEWDAMDKGPRRDLIGDLARAVRKRGLVLGLSSHRAEHWWFFDRGMEFDSDVRDPKNAGLYGPARPKAKDGTNEMDAANGPDKAFLDDWLARCEELVDRYHPQLIWFDWWIGNEKFEPYRRQFAAYYYNRGVEWNRGVAINYKHTAFPEGTAVLDVERGQLADIRAEFWQTDTAVSKNSWGYIEGQDYKTADSIVDDLVDIVSKNGALLLNIGPRPDGTIPEPEQRLLREIGAWLKANGEAVYGTRPWRVYGEGTTAVVEGSFNDTKRQAFTGRDVRFTTKGDVLYAIALAWPGDALTVKTLASGAPFARRISSVELVGNRARLKWTQTAEGLRVEMPVVRSDDYAYAFRIRFARSGSPR
jgi:alpha-L-fucosidase